MMFTPQEIDYLLNDSRLRIMLPELTPFYNAFVTTYTRLQSAMSRPGCPTCRQKALHEEYYKWQETFIASMNIFFEDNEHAAKIARSMLPQTGVTDDHVQPDDRTEPGTA